MSFFKRLGKQKTRFSFFVEVHKVTLPRGSGLISSDSISVSFERGDKKCSQSSDHPVTVQPNGDIVCEIDETLSLDVTLYKDSSGLFEEKIGKINVYQRRRGMSGLKASKDSLKSIGICNLSLHGLADGKSYEKAMPLAWTTLEGAIVYINIYARQSEENGDLDNDSESVASSQVSRSQQDIAKQNSTIKSVNTTENNKPPSDPNSALSAQNLKSQHASSISATSAQLQEQRLNTLLTSTSTSVPTIVMASNSNNTTKPSIQNQSSVSTSINNTKLVAFDNTTMAGNGSEIERLRAQVSDLTQRLQISESKLKESESNSQDMLGKANKMINDLKKENARLQEERSRSPSTSSPLPMRESVKVYKPSDGDEDIDSIRAERDQYAQQLNKLSAQLSERKVALDDAKAETIRTKVQMTALMQSLEEVKATSRSSLFALAQHATALEVKLAELSSGSINTDSFTKSSQSLPTVSSVPSSVQSTGAPPSKPYNSSPMIAVTSASTNTASAKPSNVSVDSNPSKPAMKPNPFASSSTTGFDSTMFDKLPSRPTKK